ncbi:acetyl-CoA carboxylase [Sphaerobacter thermophilus]|uniref:Biotin/lipoyl attachment domain-containing protein n=1 Tax=Sphaerobacter thermophilus (strain ATCC 49802 / DSM 20745 / KCCM 41009 / NCIMB 13125 / S 6022) TaxID=479434 RepID=D1C8T0_SPHTD|nr:acetyl-CoA carboxylase [Sphaerobacter thermophilus]ACZ40223.1 biotin/lipoyl attachment domain-containing protein [Sphaerobacter thermophilus DSM 20745]
MAQERTIKSPLPGVFYRRPNPESYVKEGDRIEAGTTIGLVGVMKSFHEIKAESGGVVLRFLVENEEPIRVGQDLLVLGD